MPRLLLPRLLVVCAFVAVSAIPTRAADATAKTLITATDLLKLKQVESPALSPDGQWVIYVVRSMEPKPDATDDWVYHTHLWLAATDGKSPPRRLTFGATNNSSPTWHPDGRRIAFVRTAGAPPQIHVLSLDGGEAAPFTQAETGAINPRWSPDGTQLLFSSNLSYAQVRAALEQAGADAQPAWPHERPARAANDTANWKFKPGPRAKAEAAKSAAKPADRPKAAADGSLQEVREWLAKNEADGNPRVTQRHNFLSENDLLTDFSFSQLHVMAAREGAEARPLALGYESKNAAAWMADSRRIVYVAPRDPTLNPDRVVGSLALHIVDSETGEKRVFLARDHESYGNPTPSPDGQWVAFTLQAGGPFSFDPSRIAVVPAAGGEPRVLTPDLDRQAANPKWSPDSRSIYFTAPSAGRFPLYRVVLERGDVQSLTWQAWGIRDFDVGREGLVQVVTHWENPSELHTAHLSAKVSRPLTRHNQEWIDGKRLAPAKEHSFTNELGLRVQYWTMKPTDFVEGKKYPLILNIHGGPSAMWGPGEASMWFEFQFYAAKGYAQVFGNPRGSGGYGREFQRANHRDWGAGPGADVLRSATEAAQAPWVDADRQVVTGGSYGGYLTAWVIAHDHRFKAAIAQRGVYDLLPFFGEGNAWFLVPLYWGNPWEPEVRQLLLEQSPMTHAHRIKTPLLIKHGDVDFRTGVMQSQMLYKTLKALGRDVEYVRYPRATHELSRSGEPKQRLDRLVRYEEFFRRYVGEN